MGILFLVRGFITPDAWTVHEDKLSATLDLLDMLPNGTIKLPDGTHRLFIEVGANSVSNMEQDDLPYFPDAFLLSFEPLLHQYAALLGRHTRPHTLRPLGQNHAHGAILPFAVGPEEGFANFVIPGEGDMCASLLQPLAAREDVRCFPFKGTVQKRRVPVVSLNTVLGKWFAWEDGGGWPIDYLKIDAQGLDVSVLLSAGALVNRIRRVEVEVPGDASKRDYEGSLLCSEIVEAMTSMGFVAAYNRSCADFRGKDYDDDWEFVQPGVEPLYNGLLPYGEACWRKSEGRDILKDFCCSDIGEGDASGCFNDHRFQVSRCCLHRWQPDRHEIAWEKPPTECLLAFDSKLLANLSGEPASAAPNYLAQASACVYRGGTYLLFESGLATYDATSASHADPVNAVMFRTFLAGLASIKASAGEYWGELQRFGICSPDQCPRHDERALGWHYLITYVLRAPPSLSKLPLPNGAQISGRLSSHEAIQTAATRFSLGKR